MSEVPLTYNKLLTSHSDLTTYEEDIISAVVPMGGLGIREAGALPGWQYWNLSSDL